MEYILFITLCFLSAVAGDTIPSSDPSIYPYSVNGYEGETAQFQCSLSTLGSPPVIWSWFCGQEQMTSGITYSTTYTYLTFKLSMKYHQRSCYCRATSPSTLLIYNRSSSRRLVYVNHLPPTKPMIYVLSSTTVRSEETIQAKCNITSLGYPQISWMWFCNNQAPVSGTAIRFESYISLKITSNDKTISCRCRATSSITYYEYDEFSDFVHFTVLSDPNNDTQCLSPVAFGTTTGLLVAIIAALSVVVILQCVRKRNGTSKPRSNDAIGHQNPAYSSEPSYETLQRTRGKTQN